MQLVFEFGSTQIQPIVEVIQRAVGQACYTIACLDNDSHTYRPTEDTLLSAATKLERSTIASFSLHPQLGPVRYALATCPFFDGTPLSLFLGTIEYLGREYQNLWNLLLGVSGLRVACVGFEEGVELEDRLLSPATFPWDHWPLVIGALRADESANSAWVVRDGPEMKWFSDH